MVDVDDFVLRHEDFDLDDVQASVRDSFRSFFTRECPPERVRAAEPLGYDAELWADLAALRPVAMGVPPSAGGDGAGVVELALVAIEVGRAAAPVPFVETAGVARLLACTVGVAATAALAEIVEHGAVAAFASEPSVDVGSRRLVAGGAAARFVVGLRGDDLVLAEADSPPSPVANLAAAPLAWWDLADAAVLVSGPDALAAVARAELERRILTAASLVGLGEVVLDEGVHYAKEREAFGVPIGTFQALAHPLADAAMAVEAARRLVLRAAWFADHEPDGLARLARIAFIQAATASETAGRTTIHVEGGFGFTLESNAQLRYRRAKGWALGVSSCGDELLRLADDLYGPPAAFGGPA